MSAAAEYGDDRHHMHSEWGSVSVFLGLVVYHACLGYVRAKIEGVVRGVWTRGVMAMEAM